MYNQTLLKCGANCAVKTVFEVELPAPPHHVREQVAVERRIVSEQSVKIERALNRGQVGEAYLPGGDLRPIGHRKAVVVVRASIAHCLEDHA